MIRNLIFDIGSVLVSFTYSQFLHRTYSEEVCRELDIIDAGTPFWRQMDLGYEDEQDGVKTYVDMVPTYKEEAAYAFLNMAYYMELIRPTADFMAAAKAAGYRLYYLSNYSRGNWEILTRRFAAFGLFDGGVVSYEAHQVKPEPGIYHTLLGRYGLQAGECLFFDDKQENTATARQLGIAAVTLRDPAQIAARAAEQGIRI